MFAGFLSNVLLAVTPLAGAFGLNSLSWRHWLIALGVAVSVIPVGELYKLAVRLISAKRNTGKSFKKLALKNSP